MDHGIDASAGVEDRGWAGFPEMALGPLLAARTARVSPRPSPPSNILQQLHENQHSLEVPSQGRYVLRLFTAPFGSEYLKPSLSGDVHVDE